ASCQTRRSNGEGRFSTNMSARRGRTAKRAVPPVRGSGFTPGGERKARQLLFIAAALAQSGATPNADRETVWSFAAAVGRAAPNDADQSSKPVGREYGNGHPAALSPPPGSRRGNTDCPVRPCFDSTTLRR